MKSRKKALFEVLIISSALFVLVLFLDSGKIQPTKMQQNSIKGRLDNTTAQTVTATSAATTITGLTINKPEKTYKGLTLYPISGTAEVQLLNMQGEVVHNWPLDADRARLLDNCNLLVLHGSKWGSKVEPWKSLRPVIREYTWNGDVAWEHIESDWTHHDVQRLENGNTLYLRQTRASKKFRDQLTDPIRKNNPLISDSIIEIDPSGETVWEWHAHEQLDVNSCGNLKCQPFINIGGGKKRVRDWTHMNTVSIVPENKWYEQGDDRFKPGNIFILPRNWWRAMLVDKETKKVVWEYDGDFRGGLMRGHEVHMIPPGLPGAGNILIFDNGIANRRNSQIIEINPITHEVVWFYEDGENFFSRAAGSMQRLPNGNTFISDDFIGRALEVTAEKEIVWEFRGLHRISRAQRYDFESCPQLLSLQSPR